MTATPSAIALPVALAKTFVAGTPAATDSVGKNR